MSPTNPNDSPARVKRPPRTEICQIKWSVVQAKVFGSSSYHFWAEGLGPHGFYNAGSSAPFQAVIGKTKTSPNAYYQEFIKSTDSAVKAFNELAEKLWSDGWQPTAFGARFWHDVKYRRPVSRSRRPAASAAVRPAPATKSPAAPTPSVSPPSPRDAAAPRPAGRPVVPRKAGWYADPTHRYPRRYWNGTEWTVDVMTARGEKNRDSINP